MRAHVSAHTHTPCVHTLAPLVIDAGPCAQRLHSAPKVASAPLVRLLRSEHLASRLSTLLGAISTPQTCRRSTAPHVVSAWHQLLRPPAHAPTPVQNANDRHRHTGDIRNACACTRHHTQTITHSLDRAPIHSQQRPTLTHDVILDHRAYSRYAPPSGICDARFDYAPIPLRHRYAAHGTLFLAKQRLAH